MIEGVIADIEPQRSIIERAIAGDEVAFARIIAAHHDDLARIAFFVSGDLDIAEEAEQSAWAVAYRRLKDLRDPDRLRPWLMSIAANEARQIGRGRRRRLVRELAVPGPRASGDVDHAAMIDLANAVAGPLIEAPILHGPGPTGAVVGVSEDAPVRLILVDLGDGQTLAVVVFGIKPTASSSFEDQAAAAMPIIDSFMIGPSTPSASPTPTP